jgi:hypothetical protein
MNSELHKNIATDLNKQDVLFNTEVINIPKEKKLYKNELKKLDNQNIWKLNDGSNDDQLKAVTGICFMLGSLVLMGLYSNLM